MLEKIILPIFTGVISGVISSIIVTQYYRVKDRERDRVKYFEELRAFYIELKTQLWAINDPDEILKLPKIKKPKLYKWIYVNQDEGIVINKIDKIYYAVISIAREISGKISDLRMEQESLPENYKYSICLNYVKDLRWYREELVKMDNDVYCLEHPEMKKTWMIYRKNLMIL